MSQLTGSPDPNERALAALFGLSFAILALRRANPLWRVLTGVAGAALLARSYVGLAGYQGRPQGRPRETLGLDPVDRTVDDSFPASDPPASRLPDAPPVNAEAKWEAVKAAGRT